MTKDIVMKDEEEKKEESVTENAILLLNNIYASDIPSGQEQRILLKQTIDLLFKIINNIIA